MTIKINHQESDIEDGLALDAVLSQHIALPVKGIAVAVNGQVIPKQQHGDYLLRPGDAILVIKATQGG